MTQQGISELMQGMTLRQKLAQMTQLNAEFVMTTDKDMETGPQTKLVLGPDDYRGIGSVLNAAGAERVRDIQQRHMEDDPHRIPLLFMADIIHGFRTVYPIPLAMGCSFDTGLMEEAARVAAVESAVSGLHITFSPMADLVRDPRWGRVMEATGEDPLLNAEMAAAAARGYGVAPFAGQENLVSCAKHFAGYGAGEAGREYNTVDMSRGMLMEYYMGAYKAAIDAGSRVVMTSFNTIDRVPATGNQWLLRDVLRGQWGFDGVVITDFNSLDEMIAHGFAANGKEAAKMALLAGVDIEMMSTHYLTYGEELVAEGQVPESYIDDAVRRILTLKAELGLFENPLRTASAVREEQTHNSAPHKETAKKAALQSCVLLKNEGVLPLRQGCKLGLAGPFANTKMVLGGWALPNDEHTVSLYEGLRAQAGLDVTMTMDAELEASWGSVADVEDKVQQACEALAGCDVIVAAVGESQKETGEGASKTVLRLSPNQEKLVQALAALGKPLVLVVFSGRPMEIAPLVPGCAAVVQAWFPGVQAGSALAALLCGQANFSGRLAISYPQSVGQVPLYYNHFATGRPYVSGNAEDRYVSRYNDAPNEPLYPFGHGLSYSTFAYEDFSAKADAGGVVASVKLRNTSAVPGVETVQLYIRDVAASVVRPVKELKAWKQVALEANEEQLVEFALSREELGFYNADLDFVFEAGEFDIMLGASAASVESVRLDVQ